MSNIIIIGSGVIGLTTAYYLTEQGHKNITIIDSGDGVASGASGINGAQLCYRYISPMKASTLFKKLPALLAGRDQRLKLKSPFDLTFWLWALRVLWSGVGSNYDQKLSSVVDLAEESRAELLQIKEKLDLKFGYQLNGKLHLFQTPQGLKGYEQSLKDINTPSSMYQIMSPAEAMAHDPFLSQCQTTIAGGILVRDEAVGNCKLYCEQLSDYLVSQHGIDIQHKQSVHGFVKSNGRIIGLETDKGRIMTEHVFICAGWGAQSLLKSIGINLGIYPTKGYSLTIPHANKRPLVNITVREHFMVFAPIDHGGLRITAFKHFESGDNTINHTVVEDMKRRIHKVMPELGLSKAEVAVGHRPMTADDIPVIGQSDKYSNLYLNCGHGAVGWTLAPGTSKRVVDAFINNQDKA